MKRFTKFFTLFFALLLLLGSCSIQETIQGNRQIVSKTIDIADYDEIQLNISGDVVYKQFSEMSPYLEIHTDENIFDLLDIHVNGDKLIFDLKDDVNIRPSKLTVYTTSRGLKNVKIAGSGDVVLQGEVNSREFKLSIAGSGNISSDSLYCEKLKVDIAGSGNAALEGASNDAQIKIAGSGDFNSYKFVVTDAKCNISGSGNIFINVIGELDASVAGSGNIRYKGSPAKVNTSVAGSGSVLADN